MSEQALSNEVVKLSSERSGLVYLKDGALFWPGAQLLIGLVCCLTADMRFLDMLGLCFLVLASHAYACC